MQNHQNKAITNLTKGLGYVFKDSTLLRQALMHASAVRNRSKMTATYFQNNQKLEFLGDRVLSLAIASYLFSHQESLSNEGDFAVVFNNLVCQEACVKIANTLDMASCIFLGKSEKKEFIESGQMKNKILTDTCEALLGAVYVDSDFSNVEKIIHSLWAPLFTFFLERGVGLIQDPKTSLQQWSQKDGGELPVYEIVRCAGETHKPNFKVKVSSVNSNFAPAFGEGSSKKKAEQNAAHAFLKREGIYCS